jgi:tRNA(Arg) A34 adenosine deaminase TadA
MQQHAPCNPPALTLTQPTWLQELVEMHAGDAGDAGRMRLAIALARENVRRGSGGPFGAAVFARGSPRAIAAGVNSVERLNNSVLHAEVMALMFAEARLGSYTLRDSATAHYELFTSCAPCAMCLGAALWSGVRRIVCAASREDAMALGFDEGPVFAQSWRYLEAHGIEVVWGVLAAESRQVLQLYRQGNGLVYNASSDPPS